MIARWPTALALVFVTSAAALAQDTAGERDLPREQIVVTGSFVGVPPAGTASVVTMQDLARSGSGDVTDALVSLVLNAGSEFNSDSATQNDTSGTAQVNLRGLGLDATLVLLDGARMTVSSVAADDGSTFVDLNALTPTIAVERIEVFADGGSALYGSDAIAGVVNVITRRDFTGTEVVAERRLASEYGTDGGLWRLAGLWGGTLGPARAMAAVEWSEQTSLEASDTTFAINSGLSTLGQPGAYRVPLSDGGLSAPIIDQDCVAGGGQPAPSGPAIDGLGQPGVCQLDFARFFSVVNNETRLAAQVRLDVPLGPIAGYVQLNGATNAIERGNSPSLPDLGFSTLPADNPGNYFGQDVIWLGRPFGASAGSARRTFDHATWRIAAGVEGQARRAGRTWDWLVDATVSRNDVQTTITDTRADRFGAAIAGFGGPDCPVDGPGQGIAPGDQGAGCLWFNPFGSGGLVTDPTDPRFNDPAVVADLVGLDVRTGSTELITLEARAVTQTLFTVPAGPVAAALGGQLRRETNGTDHGADYNAENFLFIIGGPDTEGERAAGALYTELDVPVSTRLAVQAALRGDVYEDTSAVSPRLAARLEVTQSLSLHASAARSFRAPSLFEEASATTTLENLVVEGASLFRAVRTVGDETLEPERAVSLTTGATWTGTTSTASLTAWHTDVTDIIVEESAQAIVDADLADGVFDDPRIEVAPSGDVRSVTANFVNAPEVTAWGVDATAHTARPAWGGTLSASASASWLGGYDLTDPVTGARVEAAGQRNSTNFARPLPHWRADAAATFARAGMSGTLGVRHIGSYLDEATGNDVEAWTTLDAQVAFAVGSQAMLALGARNLADAEPPRVATPLGYDTKTHDPRGRVLYARLSAAF